MILGGTCNEPQKLGHNCSSNDKRKINEDNKIEIGLDEAGRGCLFGPVFSAGVIWNGDYHKDIKDSKKLSINFSISPLQ